MNAHEARRLMEEARTQQSAEVQKAREDLCLRLQNLDHNEKVEEAARKGEPKVEFQLLCASEHGRDAVKGLQDAEARRGLPPIFQDYERRMADEGYRVKYRFNHSRSHGEIFVTLSWGEN